MNGQKNDGRWNGLPNCSDGSAAETVCYSAVTVRTAGKADYSVGTAGYSVGTAGYSAVTGVLAVKVWPAATDGYGHCSAARYGPDGGQHQQKDGTEH